MYHILAQRARGGLWVELECSKFTQTEKMHILRAGLCAVRVQIWTQNPPAHTEMNLTVWAGVGKVGSSDVRCDSATVRDIWDANRKS